ncbi:MAG: glycosyltransferase [Candidatus Staskawiczbacteria bacterium]|jgi:glycosyltransferase involved in cell wall biosynthesis
MQKLDKYKEKIAAIVPALNEEANIEKVLKILLTSEHLDEIILVDDGSVDKTAEIGEKLGVKIIKLNKAGGGGKGNAMREGVLATDAKIITFFDADLIGLSHEHIYSLIQPIVEEDIKMCVGVRGRLFGLPKLIAKIDPLMAIGGERAIRRELFEKISGKFIEGFAIEPTLNYYCKSKKIPTKHVSLKNLDVITKERKRGFINGFISRLKMILEIIKIRLRFIFNKNEFI